MSGKRKKKIPLCDYNWSDNNAPKEFNNRPITAKSGTYDNINQRTDFDSMRQNMQSRGKANPTGLSGTSQSSNVHDDPQSNNEFGDYTQNEFSKTQPNILTTDYKDMILAESEPVESNNEYKMANDTSEAAQLNIEINHNPHPQKPKHESIQETIHEDVKESAEDNENKAENKVPNNDSKPETGEPKQEHVVNETQTKEDHAVTEDNHAPEVDQEDQVNAVAGKDQANAEPTENTKKEPEEAAQNIKEKFELPVDEN